MVELFELNNYFHFTAEFVYHRALAGRTHTSISSIILFIIRYIGDSRFTRALIDVANTLLDVYEDQFKEFTGPIGRNFLNLIKALRKEEQLTKDFLEINGSLELILSAASILDQDANDAPLVSSKSHITEIVPSESAKQELIFDVN